MSINGWYAGNVDNVTDDGNINGWADQSGDAYGDAIAGGTSYRFGPILNHYGTWGQLIYSTQTDLQAQNWNKPTGLNGYVPMNPGPDNSNWVQGHLVNGDSGGSSALDANLTPITHNVNMWHAGYESVIKRLVNRGTATGAAAVQFNPHNLSNSRLIYRTHGLPPPAGTFMTVPNGLCVSLGIIINGSMKSEMEVINELNTPGPIRFRWFADRYYTAAGRNDRRRIIEMIGGAAIDYP